MLILNRKIGETIVIGDNTNITVLGVRGNQVQLRVNAPKNVSVHREEIYQRIQFQKEAEAKSDNAESDSDPVKPGF